MTVYTDLYKSRTNADKVNYDDTVTQFGAGNVQQAIEILSLTPGQPGPPGPPGQPQDWSAIDW